MAEQENYRGKVLNPGIYIGSKSVEGFPLARHQFFVLVPKEPATFEGKLQDLGQGNRGIVVGAYATRMGFMAGLGKLHYRRNHKGDVNTLRHYLDVKREPRRNVVMTRAKNPGLGVDKTITGILSMGRKFRSNTEKGNGVQYPGVFRNLLGISPNSNSFIQTISDLAGIKNRAEEHPGGIDSGSGLRINPEKFGRTKEAAFVDGYLSAEEGDMQKVAYPSKPVPMMEEAPQAIKPGVYIASKKVTSLWPLLSKYKHNFFVLIPEDPSKFEGQLVDIGGGNQGVVVGGYGKTDKPGNTILHNIKGNLNVRYSPNEPDDVASIQGFFNRNPHKSQAALSATDLQGRGIDDTITDLLSKGQSFNKNTKDDPIVYPNPLSNAVGGSGNSNSFVQSLADASKITKRRYDFPGADMGHDIRFPMKTFDKAAAAYIRRQAALMGYQAKTAGDNRRENLPLRERVEVIVIKGDKVLLQKRDGYVEMPGGGIDPGESVAQAVRRESMEEVGAKLKNLKPVGIVEARWFPGIKDTDWGMELWEEYRGSRTHFYIADLDGAMVTPTSDEGDRWYGAKWITVTAALEFMYSLPNSYGMKEYRDKQKDTIIKALVQTLQDKAAAQVVGPTRFVTYEELRILSKEAEDAHYNGVAQINPLQEAEAIMDEADDRYDEGPQPKKKVHTYAELPKEATKQKALLPHEDVASFFRGTTGTGPIDKGVSIRDNGEAHIDESLFADLADQSPVVLYDESGEEPDHIQHWREVGGTSITHKGTTNTIDKKQEQQYANANSADEMPKEAKAMVAEARLEELLNKRAAHGKPEDYWIGVDLDGTLAKYNGWVAPDHIGKPIPKMVARIQRWLREGKQVKIFTARMSGDDGTARKAIKAWTKKHIGTELTVTNVKDQYCTRIWDDKAVGVAANTGTQRSVGPGKY